MNILQNTCYILSRKVFQHSLREHLPQYRANFFHDDSSRVNVTKNMFGHLTKSLRSKFRHEISWDYGQSVKKKATKETLGILGCENAF